MGGPRYPYPKYIWSPAGGWWNNPPNWRAATAAAISVQILFSIACIQYQDKIAVYYNTRDYTATRPHGVHDSSIWDNNTRLPTGPQYKGLSSDTGRKSTEDESEDKEE